MADETEEARKKELEYLEQMRKGAAENSKQYELLNGIIEKVKKQTIDYSSRLVELSKKSKEERDASDVRKKVIKDEIESIKSSYKTKADQESELAIRQARNLSQLEGAQRELLAKEYQQVAALVKTEERQKVFNDTLATTKSYLLPLGAAAGDVAKSLAASIKGNPLEASAAMASKYAEKAGQGLSAAGTAAGGLGQSLTQSTNPKVKGLGIALQGLGLGVGALGGAAKIAGEAISTITPIIAGFQATYKKAGEAGATFGGGMTELRDIAGRAGMKMDDLVGGVEKGQEAFSRGGMNFQQASKFVGNMGKSLVEGKAATDLFALGFTDIGDRVSLAAGAFDQARARGMSLADAQKNITDLTVNYAKDLKVLQGFVGKNAEKELERGRVEAQGAAMRQKLQGESAVAFEQTYAVLAKLPGEQGQIAQKALMQMIDSGTTNIAEIRSNPAMMKALTAMAEDVKNGTQKAGDAAIENLTNAAKEARESSATMAGADRARIFSVDGIANNISNFNNALMQIKFDPGTAQENRDAVNKLTTNVDATTANMDKINQSANKVQVALEQIATSAGSINLFSKAMGEANIATQLLIDMINSATSGKTGSMMESGAKGLMDVITSPATWAVAAGAIGLSAAGKIGDIVGKLPLGAGKTLGGVVGAGAEKAATAVGTGAQAAKAGVSGLAGSAATAGASAAEAAAGAAGGAGAAGTAAKTVAKGVGKRILKTLPIIGLGFSLWDAAERMTKGDYAGAALAAAGGVASTFPGVGTGFAVAADVALAAGDATGVTGATAKPTNQPVTATPKVEPQVQVQQPSQVVASISPEDKAKQDAAIALEKAKVAGVELEKKAAESKEDSTKLLLQAVQQQTQVFNDVLDALMDINRNTKNTAAALA